MLGLDACLCTHFLHRCWESELRPTSLCSTLPRSISLASYVSFVKALCPNSHLFWPSRQGLGPGLESLTGIFGDGNGSQVSEDEPTSLQDITVTASSPLLFLCQPCASFYGFLGYWNPQPLTQAAQREHFPSRSMSSEGLPSHCYWASCQVS